MFKTIQLIATGIEPAYEYRGRGAMDFMAGLGLTDVPKGLNEAQEAAWMIGWLDKLGDSVRAARMGNPRP